jgi:hypothetical protein
MIMEVIGQIRRNKKKVLLLLAILVFDVSFIIPKYDKQYFMYQYSRHAAPMLFKLLPFS